MDEKPVQTWRRQEVANSSEPVVESSVPIELQILILRLAVKFSDQFYGLIKTAQILNLETTEERDQKIVQFCQENKITLDEFHALQKINLAEFLTPPSI